MSFVAIAMAALAISWGLARQTRNRDEASYFNGLVEFLVELTRHSLEISDYADVQRLLGSMSKRSSMVPGVLTEDGDLLLGDYTRVRGRGLEKLRGRTGLSCADVASQHLGMGKLFCAEIRGVRGGIGKNGERLGLSLIDLPPRRQEFPLKNWPLFFGILILCLAVLSWAMRRYFASLVGEPIEILRGWATSCTKDPLIPNLAPSPRFTAGEFEDLKVAFETLLTAARHESQKRQDIERRLAVQHLALQVAHDIRSPLAALEVASADVAQLPEDKRVLIRAAAGRIRDIANSLLERHRVGNAGQPTGSAPETPAPQMLAGLIEPVISERRLQHGPRSGVILEERLGAAAYGHFATVQPSEFKRLVSNLIGNSIEAMEGRSGSVFVSLASHSGSVVMSVQDEGRGIPSDVLAQLGQRGQTHGKPRGSGLGLFHARSCAQAWGGRLDIVSEPGRGTTVTVTLPEAPAPEWFVPELIATPGSSVVVLDDDESIHRVWRERWGALDAAARGVELVHVSTPDSLRDWVKADAARALGALYLLDYELAGYAETGLKLAEELGLGERSVLVTSRHEEPAVLESCARLRVRVIPKSLAGLVPIGIHPETEARPKACDAVLIDDDSLSRATWRMAASRRGKNLRVFAATEEFFASADEIPRTTPVYVDAELGDGLSGAAESRRIRDLGFTKVYLATGYPPERFAGLDHLRGVVAKTPPWA